MRAWLNMKAWLIAVSLFALAWVGTALWNSVKPLPAGLHTASLVTRLAESDVEFLPDALAPEAAAIDRAEQLIVIDQSPPAAETLRRLLARKHARPAIQIVLLTNPANEIDGGIRGQSLWQLEQAGIIVVRTRLEKLRDSSPLYSSLWRLAVGWWSDPFDAAADEEGLGSALRRRNRNANLRNLIVADDGAGGWISILNAGADSGAALEVRGLLASGIIGSELEIAGWSADDDRLPSVPRAAGADVGSIDARLLTEGAIGKALLESLDATAKGDQISLAVPHLGERSVVHALLAAAARGAHLQVLLNPDRLPNQAVAAEMNRAAGNGIELRWARRPDARNDPRMLIIRRGAESRIYLGSADMTRRGLDDLNLSADVELRVPARIPVARAAQEFFAQEWARAAPYADFADESAGSYWQYRFDEAAGLAAF
jgi:phospholipase D-like protein